MSCIFFLNGAFFADESDNKYLLYQKEKDRKKIQKKIFFKDIISG